MVLLVVISKIVPVALYSQALASRSSFVPNLLIDIPFTFLFNLRVCALAYATLCGVDNLWKSILSFHMGLGQTWVLILGSNHLYLLSPLPSLLITNINSQITH